MNRPDRSNPWLVTLLSGVTFFYFLIFAQFGYLHLLADRIAAENNIDLVLLCMSFGGVLFSILTACKYNINKAGFWIFIGFTCAGMAAAASVFVISTWLQCIIAFVIGSSLATVTVSIVPVIRALAPAGRIGRWTALGVGFAYFSCNLPFIFNSSAWDHCIYGAVSAAIGAAITIGLPVIHPAEIKKTRSKEDLTPASLYTATGTSIIVLLFIFLVWFDSAAFYLIQETPVVKSSAWIESGPLSGNASVHLLAALIGGWLIDRGWIFQSLVLAMILLFTGYFWMTGVQEFIISGNLIYLSGVSIYSSALVCYGALASEDTGRLRIIQRAALVFAVSGWIASGLGIGMARDLHRLPSLFNAVIVFVIAASSIWMAIDYKNRSDGEVLG